MKLLRLPLTILALALLVACGDEKDIDPPAELVEMEAKIGVDEVWSTRLGGGTERLRLGLRPASVDGARIYVADHDGDVLAIQKINGRIQWRTRTELPLSGGPAVGHGRVVAGSNDGDVIALGAEDGKELWRVDIDGEVLAPPAVGEKVVVVRTVDGNLRGLDATNGRELWLVEQQVPRLTVRGTSSPVIVGDLVLCGFDNGKVLAVTLAEGDITWETAIAPSRGRTELERMVDIDSTVRVVGNDVFVVGFQARAAMLALESGQIWWAREASSDRGLAIDDDAIFLASASGDIIALSRRDGSPLWEQAALHRRSLSGPALDGNYLVVGDFEGYVHWLDSDTGELLARQATDGDRITNAPLVSDGMVFVLTDSGTLVTFRSEQPDPDAEVAEAPAAEAPAPAATPADPPAADEQPAADEATTDEAPATDQSPAPNPPPE